MPKSLITQYPSLPPLISLYHRKKASKVLRTLPTRFPPMQWWLKQVMYHLRKIIAFAKSEFCFGKWLQQQSWLQLLPHFHLVTNYKETWAMKKSKKPNESCVTLVSSWDTMRTNVGIEKQMGAAWGRTRKNERGNAWDGPVHTYSKNYNRFDQENRFHEIQNRPQWAANQASKRQQAAKWTSLPVLANNSSHSSGFSHTQGSHKPPFHGGFMASIKFQTKMVKASNNKVPMYLTYFGATKFFSTFYVCTSSYSYEEISKQQV